MNIVNNSMHENMQDNIDYNIEEDFFESEEIEKTDKKHKRILSKVLSKDTISKYELDELFV